MREVILASQKRSQLSGITSDQVFSKKILTGEALAEHILTQQDLMITAEPFMIQLYDFVRGSNFVAILTDAQGCILSLIGDEAILQVAHEMKMVPGAYMSEAYIGTNAMGTALACAEPIQVSGQEHTIEAYYGWTCSCAVIRDEDQQVIGTLDLTGYIENVHSHTLGMVVAAVNAIENTMKLQKKNQQIKEHTTFSEKLMAMLDFGVLVCDTKGSVVAVNPVAAQFFKLTPPALKAEPLWRLLDRFEEMMINCRAGIPFIDQEVMLLGQTDMAHINISASPVFQEDGTLQTVILTLKDVKRSRKQTANILGGKAIYTFDKIIGQSDYMKESINFASKVADSKSTVLITGESGTGKEVFAHAIHNHSHRRHMGFVVLNCASIPHNLIESELFGYVEGAFTGAKKGGQPGKFEVADGGTLFLDEIGDMPVEMQTRLLRVIQEGVMCRVGSHQQIPVDVRIIAATNKDLEQAVEEGQFRLDLFYRLKVLPIHLPSLRERQEDIPLLVSYFNRKIAKRINRKPFELSANQLNQLMTYQWPGNIRELENTLEWMINAQRFPVLGAKQKLAYAGLSSSDYPNVSGEKSTGASPVAKGENRDAVEERDAAEIREKTEDRTHQQINRLKNLKTLASLERDHVLAVVDACANNMTEAAKTLGIGRNTLYRKLEGYRE